MKYLFRTNLLLLSALAVLSVGCADKSRRAEIEQRKAALVHKQDSALAEAQQRLAEVDSLWKRPMRRTTVSMNG